MPKPIVGFSQYSVEYASSSTARAKVNAPSIEGGIASRQQILDLHRQFPHANTCCVVDCSRDSGGDAGQANLAYPACAKFVKLFVGEVEEMDVDRRRVGVYRHHVVGQITVDRRAVLRIVSRVLSQRHADSP